MYSKSVDKNLASGGICNIFRSPTCYEQLNKSVGYIELLQWNRQALAKAY